MARDVSTLNIEIKAEDKASSVFSKLSDFIQRSFVVTVGDAANALRFLADAMSAPIASAIEQEDALKRLSNALLDLGPGAKHVVEALDAQAESLQKTTRFSDEAVIAGQAFAAGFIKSEDALKSVTQSAVDLAAGLGIDLQTAFELLTKASQGSTATLARYGLVLDENIPKGEKLAAVQQLIADHFGGRAQADANTYSGALAQLGNAWDEVLKAVGGAVVQNDSIVASIKTLTAGLFEAVPQVASFAKSIVEIGVTAVPAAIASMQRLASELRPLGVAFSRFASESMPYAIGALKGFAAIVSGVSEKIVEVMNLFGMVAPPIVKAAEGADQAGMAWDRLGKTVGVVNQELTAAAPAVERAASSVGALSAAADSTGPAFTTYREAARGAAESTMVFAESTDALNNSLILTGEGFASHLLLLNALKAAYAAMGDEADRAQQKAKGWTFWDMGGGAGGGGGGAIRNMGPLDNIGTNLPSTIAGGGSGYGGAIGTPWSQDYMTYKPRWGMVKAYKIQNLGVGFGKVTEFYTLPNGRVVTDDYTMYGANPALNPDW